MKPFRFFRAPCRVLEWFTTFLAQNGAEVFWVGVQGLGFRVSEKFALGSKGFGWLRDVGLRAWSS